MYIHSVGLLSVSYQLVAEVAIFTPHTHTHTHIYIYIYIYIHSVGFLSVSDQLFAEFAIFTPHTHKHNGRTSPPRPLNPKSQQSSGSAFTPSTTKPPESANAHFIKLYFLISWPGFPSYILSHMQGHQHSSVQYYFWQ